MLQSIEFSPRDNLLKQFVVAPNSKLQLKTYQSKINCIPLERLLYYYFINRTNQISIFMLP